MNCTRRTLIGSALAGLGALTVSPAHAWLSGPAGRETSCDVLVIGSGLSGIAAALAAQEKGARVLLIDKAKKAFRGGNSRVCLGSFLMPENDSEDARKAFVEDVSKKSLGGGRLDLYNVLADNILDTVTWAEARGGRFEPWLQQKPWRVGVRIASPGQYKGMPKLLEALHSHFEKASGEARYDTKARMLLLDQKGAVVGCRVSSENGLEDIRAKAVVLASGGYSANRAMLEEAHPGGASILIRGNKWITGDGIAMAREIGAGVRGMAGVESLHLPVVYNGPTGRGSPTRALPFCLGINKEGMRFVDESLGYASFGKAVLRQSGQTASLVFDETLLRTEKRIGMSIELFKRAGGGLIEAENVSDLAAKLGVSAAVLRKTLEEFNAAVRPDGTAPDAVPAKSQLAVKLNLEGKLYAFTDLTPSITMVYGGLLIDKDARVLEDDGRVIRGLFAAGETVNLYYHDYHGGGILSQCLVFGRIAGRNAAEIAAL